LLGEGRQHKIDEIRYWVVCMERLRRITVLQVFAAECVTLGLAVVLKWIGLLALAQWLVVVGALLGIVGAILYVVRVRVGS
jgi:hypothetical protein